MRAQIVLFLVVTIFTCGAAAADNDRDLPTRFSSDRVFVAPQTASGKTVEFYVDSGGGANMLCRATAEELTLKLTPLHDPEAEQELGKNLANAPMPIFKPEAGIPSNAIGDKTLLIHDCKNDGSSPFDAAGFLSSRWLAGRVWTWDYPGENFRVEGSDFRPDTALQRIPIAFKTDSAGKRLFHMIRFTVRIDGEPLDMLLDTGATTTLSTDALNTLGDGLPAARAASFIVASKFKQWHDAHPDWRVVDHSDSRFKVPMIAVPDVEIAGAHVGPVWFSARKDENFHDFMSAMTDKQIEGAIGGNALRHFVMTIDYPNAVAYFRCVTDCRASQR